MCSSPRRPHWTSFLATLMVLVGCVACAGPSVATIPTQTTAARPTQTAAASPTTEPALPTTEVTLEPAASAPATSTISPTSEPLTTPSPEPATAMPRPSLAPATETATPHTLSACGQAHVATAAESVDLHQAGRLLAPQLDTLNQYRLDLILDRETATVSGTQTLAFTNRTSETLTDLLFHLYPNLPEFGGSLEVGCAAIDGIRIEPLFEDDRWIMRLPLPRPLARGEGVDVTLRFRTTSPLDDAVGYGAFGAADDLWALASFYPLLAIRVDGEWDTLHPNGWGDFVNSDAALYHVQVAFPLDHLLVASGEASSNCDGSACTATVVAGPHRDFTMALGLDWEQARRTVGQTVVVSSFPPEQRDAGERTLELGADAVTRFNATFGPYPHTEMDIIPVPAQGFAGVEYPGLMMIGDQYYLDPDNPRLDLQDVVVHEVAHMWWFAVVGNDVLREPWLDEGLTSWSGEYLYTELSGQGTKPLTQSRQAQIERAGLGDEPIDQAVAEYDDAGDYVGVIYGRAPLFFDALRQELGDDLFFNLLREHYRRNAFGQATTDSFILLAEEVAGRQLETVLQAWFSSDAE